VSFATLRQTVLRAHALSTDRFAEDVELIDAGADARTVRVKITHEQSGPRKGSRQAASDQQRGTFDERERIEVLCSRDASWEAAIATRPQPACELRRAEAVDADTRPFTFVGEVIYEGDQHAVYLFERPRRVIQGRGL
jgi:hypothetical protein